MMQSKTTTLGVKTYYYVHTGHRIGLDRFRRACTIIRSLGDMEITLLCSDFRIAQVASDFGVKNCVGLDVIRNIPQIAHHGDNIIFDSEEANPIMLDDMRKYFSTFIRLSDSKDDTREEGELLITPYLSGEKICNSYVIDDKYFEKETKSVEISYFFGDDDYSKDLQTNISLLDGLNPTLQLGFYYFLDYEDMLKEKFSNTYEFEEYDTMIKKSKILITASPQAVLENLASGGKPIYLQRDDYTTNFQELFIELNVPIIKNYNKNNLYNTLETIDTHNYGELKQNGNTIRKFIKDSLLFITN